VPKWACRGRFGLSRLSSDRLGLNSQERGVALRDRCQAVEGAESLGAAARGKGTLYLLGQFL
jgi:hypothetical protein